MKIALDISDLNPLNKTRGVGVYAKNLYEALKKYTELDVKLVEEKTDEKFDLVHYPYFDLFARTLKVKSEVKILVTIHDVTPLFFPKAYPPGVRGSFKHFLQKQTLKKVDGVITDSEASKKDIVKYLKYSSEKVFPVYLAQSDKFKVITDKDKKRKVKEKYNLPEKFAVFVGNVNFNKNLLNQTQACIEAGLDFCLIGSSFEKKENLDHPELESYKHFLEKYEKNPLVHILGFVEDDDLVAILNLAAVSMFASTYEGFGLPILEAQACGIPVITSNVSSTPEVAGDGAILVDPENVKEIKVAIDSILNNDKLRKEMIDKGFKNLKRFSWEKTAKETASIYEKFV